MSNEYQELSCAKCKHFDRKRGCCDELGIDLTTRNIQFCSKFTEEDEITISKDEYNKLHYFYETYRCYVDDDGYMLVQYTDFDGQSRLKPVSFETLVNLAKDYVKKQLAKSINADEPRAACTCEHCVWMEPYSQESGFRCTLYNREVLNTYFCADAVKKTDDSHIYKRDTI